ncbi:BgTH12-04895 [Blumeria graminis f. sp. triticale]|uniref:Bgt-1531 n=3 Tax=Blumeria graminis TaxID=34373 RepID=A0A9X9L7S0_BLUGR|nr:hypothetical protein BGT96224_1531 [Blumeria graminis f. sp. tritici 96224]CAD6499244.1 BgTH12-04895 [Blumeria graminis f. sp. triticale]VCU39362.1 Bgt-1531 [Blumeria graminis f. sp. tritici]
MKFSGILSSCGGAVLLFSFSDAKTHIHNYHSHSQFHRLDQRHGNSTSNSTRGGNSLHGGLQKGSSSCQFPKDAGLVAITPESKNAGWAMSPDESCSSGSYCPYACPSGQVMAQWNPQATSYTYPQSMDGGLYCDRDGQVKKPFPEKPYCVPGTGGVVAHNKVGKGVSFCQTVLPGNEAMLIPTHVEEMENLAVPGTNYWCKSAAHYYINPPGVAAEDACVWGDGSKPIGNWSPYVAGANTDTSGQTFVKVGWNPIYTGSSLSKTPPSFGVKIVCESGGCNGTPCGIDPSAHGVGSVQSANEATGAGGANFCVVTVPKGGKANIEVFGFDGKPVKSDVGSEHDDNDKSDGSASKPSQSPNPTADVSKDKPNNDTEPSNEQGKDKDHTENTDNEKKDSQENSGNQANTNEAIKISASNDKSSSSSVTVPSTLASPTVVPIPEANSNPGPEIKGTEDNQMNNGSNMGSTSTASGASDANHLGEMENGPLSEAPKVAAPPAPPTEQVDYKPMSPVDPSLKSSTNNDQSSPSSSSVSLDNPAEVHEASLTPHGAKTAYQAMHQNDDDSLDDGDSNSNPGGQDPDNTGTTNKDSGSSSLLNSCNLFTSLVPFYIALLL